MSQLLDLFRFSKLLQMKDGEITLMKTHINIIPTDILRDLQKSLIEAMGFEKAYDQIYEQSKEGSKKYNSSFIEKLSFKDKRKTLDWQLKIVTFSGWGKLEVAGLNFKENRIDIKYSNSPFALDYGKSKFPVCIIPTGFTAGGVSVNFGSDLEGIETKCMAMGDPYCKMEIGPKEYIAERKKELWSKWGLMK